MWIVALVCYLFCFYTKCYSQSHLCCVYCRDVQSGTPDSSDRRGSAWVCHSPVCFLLECWINWILWPGSVSYTWIFVSWRPWPLIETRGNWFHCTAGCETVSFSIRTVLRSVKYSGLRRRGKVVEDQGCPSRAEDKRRWKFTPHVPHPPSSCGV